MPVCCAASEVAVDAAFGLCSADEQGHDASSLCRSHLGGNKIILVFAERAGLLGLVLAGATIWVDRTYSDVVPFFQSLGAVTTRSVLQTIATASITVISLTYSITLVVFTLAAGNIGPRLLTRFRESTQTRLSIGVFCCTFLFAITVLNFVGDDHTPRLSAMIAFLLAIISVYVLIFYVQHVSSQVLVDNEVAKAAERVHAAVSALIQEGKLANRGKHRQIPLPNQSGQFAHKRPAMCAASKPNPCSMLPRSMIASYA